MRKPVIRHTHVIDAAGRPVGRIATEVARLLIGKHKVSFVPHEDRGDAVLVKNASRAALTGRKLKQKEMIHHSLHIGGLKREPTGLLMKSDPAKVLRHAVSRMLPKNTFRVLRLRRLQIIR